MPLNTLSVLLNSRKRVGNNVPDSSGRYLGSLVASLQPMLIHGSYLGESMNSVNPTSHDVQRYHSDLSNDELETLMGDADTLKGDDFKANIASNETGPRYVYYRVFTKSGPLPSNAAYDEENSYLGRIISKDVAPPHNVTSLKRCIAKSENIQDWRGTTLFQKPSSETPMEDSLKVNIMQPTGLGCSSDTPLALVATGAPPAPEAEPSRHIPIYLQYFLYNEDGSIPSKSSFNFEEPSLGRIDLHDVAPPRTVASIKWRVAAVESNPALVYSKLFSSLTSELPMDDGCRLARVGRMAPMAFVQVEPGPRGIYVRKCIAKREGGIVTRDSNWLGFTFGQVLYVDGVKHRQIWRGKDPPYYSLAYKATDAKGAEGFVDPDAVQLC